MVTKLSELVTAEAVMNWLIIALLLGYFVYKEWPEFRKRVSRGAVKEKAEEIGEISLNERLSNIETEVRQMDEKLDRDYKRINKMEAQIERMKTAQANTSEELTIIMEALLGALGGLQELGAKGPTKSAESNIQEYLNKKAHRDEY
jgi:hypothetical protein